MSKYKYIVSLFRKHGEECAREEGLKPRDVKIITYNEPLKGITDMTFKNTLFNHVIYSREEDELFEEAELQCYLNEERIKHAKS